MTGQQFEHFIKFLRHSHGLGTPKEEVMDFLYEQVGNLPHDAVEWMQNRFLSTHTARFPQILHTAIKELYQEWLRENPDKQSWRKESCSRQCRVEECVDGLLFAEKEEPDLHYMASYVFRCPCLRSDAAFQIASVAKLQMAGYRVYSGPHGTMKDSGSINHEHVEPSVNYEAVAAELESVRRYKEQHGIDDPPF